MSLGEKETDEEKFALVNRPKARIIVGKFQMLPPQAVDEVLIENAFRRLRHMKYKVCVCMHVCCHRQVWVRF
jgi:hypothetical protein